ncbi:type II secretion system F family protein [Halorubrum ezzemoulense]|uniref:type II secretion system F family protein n=1 Tax=Halorubrum ezzemoulense TaxID=337243 RepID=UPI00232D18F8|nr:type II secretion system F family protein [Halorubrum ezzemoulense]MDB2224489.1 type II secretion system F family protein [Halorubrum ezzemoulense]MDB2273870.1 type II secretion system F family protein [Halorubrum ezzemoulense]MDB9300402.1 type II secretion system F family protein [Halorubrum ezzemoulense]
MSRRRAGGAVEASADGRGAGRTSADDADATDGLAAGGRLAVVGRVCYALFARHASDRRHDADRKRYRGTALDTGFETYLARAYACSWVVAVAAFFPALIVATGAAPAVAAAVEARFGAALLSAGSAAAPAPTPDSVGPLRTDHAALLVALGVALLAKRATVAAAGLGLRWVAATRRTDIERTLPGAVRYLELLSSGSDEPRAMLRKAADGDAYGATATSLRKALNAARLAGSLDEGLRRVARDTPSRELLAPFLLKFRKRAAAGDEALSEFLATERRMLSHRQDRARKRARRFLELLTELFVAVLVLPALLVIGATALSVVIPELLPPVETPVGVVPTRAVVLYGAVAVLVAFGLAAAVAVGTLRPPSQRVRYEAPASPRAVVATAGRNPASTAIVAAAPAVGLAAWLAFAGYTLVNVVLVGYAGFAVPVGLVAARRTRIDDAKDRELADFVHAVSGHVAQGRPLEGAVAAVARDVDLGVLDDDVADLAFALRATTAPAEAVGVEFGSAEGSAAVDVRGAAIERFVDRIDTPLAARTLGLVTGALDAGGDADAVFETLRIEVGRLYSEQRALRSSMQPYIAVGWAAAVLVAGVVAVVNTQVVDAARLAEIAAASEAVTEPEGVYPELERFRLYVVTQATVLASGWFAGTAARGRYAALLHSGALVACCYVVFTVGGLV